MQPLWGTRAGNLHIPCQCVVVLYFISQSTYNGAYDIPADALPKRPLPKQGSSDPSTGSINTGGANKGGDSTQGADKSVDQPPSEQPPTAKPSAGSTSDAAQFPLAMSPNDEGWSDLVGTAPGPRMNATFVTLARNSDVWDIAKSIREIEDRFNRRYNYDWVFINDKPFDETFKKVTTSLVSGNTYYDQIPEEQWSFPEWIDQDKAAKVRQDMKERKIIYGDSISYRHMCRFESGFFFRQTHMMNYEYYWRVEPNVKFFCDLHYDPFRYMAENGKKYAFVLSLYEYIDTIPTLWESTKKFMKNHPEHIAEDNSMGFLSDDGGETYNRCHFVSDFLFLAHYRQANTSFCSGRTSRLAVLSGFARNRTSTSSSLLTATAASSMSDGATPPCTPSPQASC